MPSTRRQVLIGTAATVAARALPGAVTAVRGDAASGAGSGTVTTRDGVTLYYKDWGSGTPIVFHHGWTLSADDWDNQMLSSSGRAIA